MTTYQKLKAENKRLQEDIYNLIRKADEQIGIQTKARYELLFDLEDAVWFGSTESIRN